MDWAGGWYGTYYKSQAAKKGADAAFWGRLKQAAALSGITGEGMDYLHTLTIEQLSTILRPCRDAEPAGLPFWKHRSEIGE